MKSLLCLTAFLVPALSLCAQGSRVDTHPDTPLLATPAAPGRVASESVIAAVRAADDARLAATKAADAKRLNALLSDALHYGHSNGKADTKASLVAALTSGRTAYENFDYKERTFIPAGPGVVLMKGRVLVTVRANQQKNELDLAYLAVWREEGGQWRFLAWQSCKNPPADAAK